MRRTVTIRPGQREDADACGLICYEAFADIADQHRFPRDFPSVEVAVGLLGQLLSHPGFFAVVAELEGRIVGSNFLDERSWPVVGGRPDLGGARGAEQRNRAPAHDRRARARARQAASVRLLQDAYHNRSFALYTTLGFETRSTTAVLQGPPPRVTIPGCAVRPARPDDIAACNQLCLRVHGHHRGGELQDAVARGVALVVERAGRLSGYTTGVEFFGHTIGESNDDIKALIAATPAFQRTRLPRAHQQSRTAELVLRAGAAHGESHDADEHRPVHHAAGASPALGAVLRPARPT